MCEYQPSNKKLLLLWLFPLVIVLALILSACSDDAPSGGGGGGGGGEPTPRDQPLEQNELTTLASIEKPPVEDQDCGPRECGNIGYGFGYNVSKGTAGFGWGTDGINFF